MAGQHPQEKQYDNEMRIYMRENNRMKDSHPEFRGELYIEGKKYEFALWSSGRTEKGFERWGGKLQVAEDKPKSGYNQRRQQRDYDPNDDIPYDNQSDDDSPPF